LNPCLNAKSWRRINFQVILNRMVASIGVLIEKWKLLNNSL